MEETVVSLNSGISEIATNASKIMKIMESIGKSADETNEKLSGLREAVVSIDGKQDRMMKYL